MTDTIKAPMTVVAAIPNATGRLHLGHALNTVLIDVIVRALRATGHEVAYGYGVDHAGLHGELVARSRVCTDLTRWGRQRTLEVMWKWHDTYRQEILDDLRSLNIDVPDGDGVSPLDVDVSSRLQAASIRLVALGVVYRERAMTNWCITCETAVGFDETEREEISRTAYRFDVRGVDGAVYELVTLEPALLLGATAVRAPQDGCRAWPDRIMLPSPGRDVVPLIVDEQPRERDFGTCLSLVVPAFNADDFEMARRDGFSVEDLVDSAGRMAESCGRFAGMSMAEASATIVGTLEEAGLAVGRTEYLHGRSLHKQCGGVVIPRPSWQWYISRAALRKFVPDAVLRARAQVGGQPWLARLEAAYDAVANPDNDAANPWWEGACLAFIEGYSSNRDWMISRQNAWGIPIPMRQCDLCGWAEAVGLHESTQSCPRCGVELGDRGDVFDVFFHSTLWPLCWAEPRPEGPVADICVIGHDILEFCVPASELLAAALGRSHGSVRRVVVHGVVVDADGRKMSKSLGNTISIEEAVAEYGAEAVRRLLLSCASTASSVENVAVDVSTLGAHANETERVRQWFCEPGGSEGAIDDLTEERNAVAKLIVAGAVGAGYAHMWQVLTVNMNSGRSNSGGSPALREMVGWFHPSLVGSTS